MNGHRRNFRLRDHVWLKLNFREIRFTRKKKIFPSITISVTDQISGFRILVEIFCRINQRMSEKWVIVNLVTNDLLIFLSATSVVCFLWLDMCISRKTIYRQIQNPGFRNGFFFFHFAVKSTRWVLSR